MFCPTRSLTPGSPEAPELPEGKASCPCASGRRNTGIEKQAAISIRSMSFMQKLFKSLQYIFRNLPGLAVSNRFLVKLCHAGSGIPHFAHDIGGGLYIISIAVALVQRFRGIDNIAAVGMADGTMLFELSLSGLAFFSCSCKIIHAMQTYH